MPKASTHRAKKKITEDELVDYSPLVRGMLAKRGITTKEEAEKFLHPDYERDTHDPFLMMGMKRAVDRILGAMKNHERVIIYSDYDTDGIPGGVILHDFFKKVGYENFGNYIPDRHEEGYGLNHEAIKSFVDNGAKLMITVDCGISDVDEVKFAQEKGIDVIVTDHHLVQEVVPPAYVILNSKQPDDPYPEKMLAGAGVAYKLAQALLTEGRAQKMFDVPEGWEKWLLDMAGIATVADMVPLLGENRALAYFGLKVLRKSPRPGLRKLLSLMRVDQSHITETDIGFMIGPRINAASRMDVPMEAFLMLATRDPAEADTRAKHLNRINDVRKGLVASMIKEARYKLTSSELREVIVIGNPDWRPGVLGLVANRLMEEFERPAFVWGRGGGDSIKGSCRSDGTVNVVELMTSVSEEVFIDVGGHAMSGGFSVSHEQIHFLEDKLVDALGNVSKSISEKGTEDVEAELSLDDVTWDTYKEVEMFAPFGEGNPKPFFSFPGIHVEEIRIFGKEKNHIELIFKNSRGWKVSAIGFFFREGVLKNMQVDEGMTVDLYAAMEKSVFRGRPELRLRIEKIVSG